MQHVDVKHPLSFDRDSRLGRSLLRGYAVIRVVRVQRIRHPHQAYH